MTELTTGQKQKHKLEPPDSWINAGIGQMTSTNVLKTESIIDKEEEVTQFDHLRIDLATRSSIYPQPLPQSH
jgi:hypothetical protein